MRWLRALPFALMFGVAVLCGLALFSPPAPMQDPLVGTKAPVIPGLTENSGGQPYLLHLFAHWCAPCEAEMPLLLELSKQGVLVYGVAWKDRVEDVEPWLVARGGSPFVRWLADPDGEIMGEFGATGVPETLVVGADGVILYRHRAPLTEAWIRSVILPRLQGDGI